MGEDGETDPMRRPKILFLVTEDWYFCSHRMALGRAAVAAGYDVALATRVRDHGQRITDAGIRLIPLPWKRKSTNLPAEIRTLYSLYNIYEDEHPDIVHHVALKPVFYGSMIARLTGTRCVINAVAGFGYSFTSVQKRAVMARRLLRLFFRRLSNRAGTTVLVQNPDDRDTLVLLSLVDRNRVVMIPGSGVDTVRFTPVEEPPGPPRLTLVSRMLWSKGVGEFVEAARILGERGVEFEAALVGDPDPENPQAIPLDQLVAWNDEGLVSWRGHAEDVAAEWGRSHIAVLPSYREGLPKTLLEAAACGRPIVATDVPGCREIVKNGVNGLLVPAFDAPKLADAIERLIKNRNLRLEMGRNSRLAAVNRFSEEVVISQILNLYRSILEAPGR